MTAMNEVKDAVIVVGVGCLIVPAGKA